MPELLDGVFAKGLQVLEPEFISPQDGHEKQDCKRAAIKRWVKRNAERLARHQCTLLGDDLYACQPMCELFLEAGFNYILVCKPESHVALRYFFNDLRASLRYILFYNWNHLIRFMLLGLELIPDT